MTYLSDLTCEADEIRRTVCRNDWTDTERADVESAARLRAELADYQEDSDGDVYLIHEAELAEHAEEYICNTESLTPASLVWNYINFDRLGRDLTDDMRSVSWRGETYYARG